MIRIGAVADDLTGATTAAALLARSGVPSVAYWDVDLAAEGGKTAEAVLLSTGSRAMPGQDAYRAVRHATRVLRRMGARQYQKRIDTTLRGGIGVEIDAMLDELPGDMMAVVVPAMPQNRKIVVDGVSLIDGQPLSETEVRNDALTPVRESFVPRLLSSQTRRTVSQITLATLREGPQAVATALKRHHRNGIRVVVMDAASLEDIETLAEGCRLTGLPILSVDPGQFTASLLRAEGEAEAIAAKKPDSDEAAGTVLVAVGSTTKLTCTQIERLCADPRHVRIRVDAEALLGDPETRGREIEKVLTRTREALAQEPMPRALVLETASAGRQLGPEEDALRDQARRERGFDPVNDALGVILSQLLAEDKRRQICGLYLSGGDTMASVLCHLDAECIAIEDYIIPQVDVCRLIGGVFDGMVVVSKGGLTGDAEIANLIVSRILREAAASAPAESEA